MHASNVLLIQFSVCNLFSSTSVRLRKAVLSCDVLWLQVSCRGGNFRYGVWAQMNGLVKWGKGAESVSAVVCHLLSEPQPRENEALTVSSLPGETESPIRQLLPSSESHVLLCLSSPPCLLSWVSRLSAVPHLWLLTSLCSRFPAFQGLSFSCRGVPFNFLGVPISLLFDLFTQSSVSIDSPLCPPGTSSLCLH